MSTPKVEAQLPYASLNAKLKPMFKTGELYRVMFPEGYTLFKLSHENAVGSGGLLKPKLNGEITEWWFSYETVTLKTPSGKYELPGVVDPIRRAGAIKADFGTFMRARAAVNWDWKNPMTHVVVAQLARDSVGLVGTCSGQQHGNPPSAPAADLSRVSFIGGARQVCLLHLKPHDMTVLEHGRI